MISKPAIVRRVQVQDTGNEMEIEITETKTTLQYTENAVSKPHGKILLQELQTKNHNRYTDIEKGIHTHNTKVIHQITREQ